MKTENAELLNSFIIEVQVLTPLSRIINGLNEDNYQDCDIKWLDAKLDAFIKLAANTLNIGGLFECDLNRTPFPVLNNHNKKYYVDKFTKLRDYFKTF